MLVHSPLASIVSDEMLAPILTLILLYTICLFFLLPLLLRVFLYLWFSAVVLCSYVWFSLYLSYLGFVESLGLVSRWFFLIKFGSVFFFFLTSLSPLFSLCFLSGTPATQILDHLILSHSPWGYVYFYSIVSVFQISLLVWRQSAVKSTEWIFQFSTFQF